MIEAYYDSILICFENISLHVINVSLMKFNVFKCNSKISQQGTWINHKHYITLKTPSNIAIKTTQSGAQKTL